VSTDQPPAQVAKRLLALAQGEIRAPAVDRVGEYSRADVQAPDDVFRPGPVTADHGEAQGAEEPAARPQRQHGRGPGSVLPEALRVALGFRGKVVEAPEDDGLAAALRDLARTTPVPVEVEASRERVAASVEAAAYFVACEAITNAVKHATPSKVAVRTYRDNGTLHVSVADDGVGGAVVRRGSGLAGLRDRVAAHGGTFAVVSPHGGGTTIEVAIPCES